MMGLIFARSGLATKKGLRPANCVGLIDPDYRGEYIVALYNDSAEERIIDVEEIKEISAKTVEESVRPIARKNIKEG